MDGGSIDGYMFSLGEQFIQGVGRNRFYQLPSTTTQFGNEIHAGHRLPPPRAELPTYPLPSTYNASAPPPYPQQVGNGMTNTQPHSYAAAVREGTQARTRLPAASSPNTPSTHQQGSERARRTPAMYDARQAQSNSSHSTSSGSTVRGDSYAQVARTQHHARHDAALGRTSHQNRHQQQYLQPDLLANDLEYQMQNQPWLAYINQIHDPVLSATCPAPNTITQPTLNDIVRNPNYMPGITETANSVAGWNSQSRNIGDRTVLTVDTSHLQPSPIPYTPRSPASVTSATSSQPSKKRNRDEMRSGDFPFSCIVCEAGFYTSSDLWHHFRYHGERPWVCNVCHHDFVFDKDLKRHQAIHDPNARKHTCTSEGCTSAFKRPDHLLRHVKTRHTSDSGLGPSRRTSVFNGQ